MTALGAEIACRLERLMLHQTEVLIVDRVGSPYYVQFIATPHGELHCEAVGNDYLDSDERLDQDDELTLIGLGWSSPTPNFSQLWDEPLPFAEIGERMARTLIEVFGVRDACDVAYTYGRSAIDCGRYFEPMENQ